MMATQSEYYSRRADVERMSSCSAKDPKVAAIHLEMARRYDELASSDGNRPIGRPTLRIVTREYQLEQ
jgi:GH25 family lysozyme M1 (1,4-beta-N-acetylmuramidase)